MKLIQKPEELEVNRTYWLRNKGEIKVSKILYDKVRGVGTVSFKPFTTTIFNLSEERMLELCDIIGPIPKNEAPDFDLFIEAFRSFNESQLPSTPAEMVLPLGKTILKLEMKTPTEQEIKNGLS